MTHASLFSGIGGFDLARTKTHGSITPKEAEREFACMRLGARIYDLKERGVPIESKIEFCLNKFGKETHYSRYFLKN